MKIGKTAIEVATTDKHLPPCCLLSTVRIEEKTGNDNSLELLHLNRERHPLNPSTPISDQDKISPYNINTISSRQVMRIKKNINQVIVK